MSLNAIRLSILLLLLPCPAALHAQAPSATPSDHVVGRVFAEAITAADIGSTRPVDLALRFDSRDTARWALMERVLTTFGEPVLDRFVAERKIEASAAEIRALRENARKWNARRARDTEEQLATLQAALASPDLRTQDRAKLEERQELLATALRGVRATGRDAAPESMAREFIVAWKIERELHRAYGGRVISQQAGPEALDARGRLFAQAEKRGDLKFDAAGVRHLFYHYYANMRHTAIDEQAIERPWFLEDQK